MWCKRTFIAHAHIQKMKVAIISYLFTLKLKKWKNQNWLLGIYLNCTKFVSRLTSLYLNTLLFMLFCKFIWFPGSSKQENVFLNQMQKVFSGLDSLNSLIFQNNITCNDNTRFFIRTSFIRTFRLRFGQNLRTSQK